MAKKVFIIPSGLLTQYNNVKMIEAMEKAGFNFGFLRWKLFWNLSALQRLAQQFNLNQLNSDEFYEQISSYFPESQVDKEPFFNAWKVGVGMDSEVVESINQLFNLALENDIEILITANSNPVHMDCIMEQLEPRVKAEWEKGIFSYRFQTLEVAKKAIETALTSQKLEAICLVVREPVIEGANRLNPLAQYFYYRAKSAYNFCTALATDYKITTFNFQGIDSLIKNIQSVHTVVTEDRSAPAVVNRALAPSTASVDQPSDPDPVYSRRNSLGLEPK